MDHDSVEGVTQHARYEDASSCDIDNVNVVPDFRPAVPQTTKEPLAQVEEYDEDEEFQQYRQQF